MARTLKELLLEPWNGTSKRLFSSQREIARVIAGRQGSDYEGKPDSLAVFINQIVGHSRPCPLALSEELLAAANEAAKRIGIDEKQVDRELRAVLFGTPTNKALTVSDLLLKQMKAKEVVVVSPGTIEDRGHPLQGEFIDVTISKLIEDPETRYCFFIDAASDRAAIKQEEGLLFGVERHLEAEGKPVKEAEGLLKILLKQNRVQIEKLPSELLIIPVVAFEPSGTDFDADVYVWDWDDADGGAEDYVAKLSRIVKKRWLEFFFFKHLRPILRKPASSN